MLKYSEKSQITDSAKNLVWTKLNKLYNTINYNFIKKIFFNLIFSYND